MSLASRCQWEHVVRMSCMAISKTKSAYRDLAKSAVKGQRFAVMIGTERRSFRVRTASTSTSSIRLPAASRRAQVMRRQRSPLWMTRFSARVAIQNLKHVFAYLFINYITYLFLFYRKICRLRTIYYYT